MNDIELQEKFKKSSRYFCAIVFFVGILVLTGWQFDIEILKRPVHTLVAMNPASALCFIFSCTAFILLTSNKISVTKTNTGSAFAIIILIIGVFRVTAVITGLNLHVDEILFSGKLKRDEINNLSTHMSGITAFNFILAGAVLLLLKHKGERSILFAQSITLIIAFTGLFSLLGYIYQVNEFYGILKSIPLAIHTSACFLLFSVALLFANPEKGVMRIYTTSLTGGITSRIMIPVAILCPVLLGYIRLLGGWHGLYSTEFGVTILILSIIIVFLLFISYNAVLLNKADNIQKAADEKNRTTEKNCQLMVDSVKDYAIFMVDTNGRVANWNNGAEHIKGYSAQEIIGKPMDVFYTAAEIAKEEPKRNLQMALKQGHFETEGWRVRKDGSTFYANIVFTALIDEEGSLYGYAKVTKDITEKRRAEERLRFLASIADNIQDPVISTDNPGDKNFIITRWNKPAEKLLEWKSEEVIGKNDMEIFKTGYPYETREQIFELLKAKGFWRGEIIYYTKSGKPVYVLSTISHLKDAQGNINGNLVLIRDISERKKAEEALSKLNAQLEEKVKERTEEIYKNEKQFRQTLDSMLEGMQIIGFDWRYIYVNDAMAKHGKYLKEEMIGHTVMEKYPGIEQTEIYKVYQRCFNERVPIHLEYEFIFPDKTKGWFELSFQPVPEGLFILSVDITDRKIAEEKIIGLNKELEERVIKRTEQLKKSTEEMEAFSYSVSHDLRAPLRGIIGFANILEEDYGSKLDDEAKRITRVIKNNTTKMGRLIDDLLTFSRMGKQELIKTNINTNKIVREIMADFDLNENNKKIEWIIHSLPFIRADINTINQVWINLISNAVKYSGNVAQPKIEIGSIKENDTITFFVKDNGVGFDEKYKAKLFKVFQRLHTSEEFEGTGIGLAIIEKIVSKHGGKVWAEGELNKGATFYFSLPVDKDQQTGEY